MKRKFTPVKLETKLTNYLRVPREALSLGLSSNALAAYALLLERAFYSQKNKLAAPDGRVYCYYPRERLARDLGCCDSSAANSLKRLCEAGLIEKQVVKNGIALRIFVNIPKPENSDSFWGSSYFSTGFPQKNVDNQD
jgi:hypothetical protein